MAIVNSDNGQLLTTVPIGKGVDGCAFDPQLRVAVSSNGADGTVTVVSENPPGEFSVVQTLPTLKTGRTIANNPQTSQFFIPATIPAEGETPAATWNRRSWPGTLNRQAVERIRSTNGCSNSAS